MIITELVLHNFGVYAGRQVFQMEPPSLDKPVVLIGGLNGGGKTTILDAVQLALYGNRARCSTREKYSYPDFLMRSINRVTKDRMATVELEFTTQFGGKGTKIRICRRWNGGDNKVKEHLQVWRDGEPDRLLTSLWSQRVEEFFPLDIAQLFFFDGERIEALADTDRSKILIETGINSLLGVDLIRQLDSDLNILIRRKLANKTEDHEAQEISDLELEIQEAEKLRRNALTDQAQLQAYYEQGLSQLESAERLYRREGGELYESRTNIEHEMENIQRQISEREEKLRELAIGQLPFILVDELLQVTLERSMTERDTAVQYKVSEYLSNRNRDFLRWMKTQKFERDVRESIAEYMEANMPVLSKQEPLILDLGSNVISNMMMLRDEYLEKIRLEAKVILEELEKFEWQATERERLLSEVPDEARIKPILNERDKMIVKVDDLKTRLETAKEVFEKTDRDIISSKEQLVRLLDRRVDDLLERDESERTVIHANRVRNTLGQFRDLVVKEHIERIEQTITDCLNALFHKELLVDRVRLDVNNFDMTLESPDGVMVPADKLSAGERQLLAVAFLWALAIVSGKSLPTIIDTPLGRLDSLHRDRLVTRYFPYASRQVLLLSTDEEIDSNLYKLLQPHVGHQYRLEFDDSTQTTTIVSGYFWSEEFIYVD